MIREANTADFPAMEAVFRDSARALCANSYSAEVIHEWTNEYRPERFSESEQQGNLQYVLLQNDQLVCFGSINLSSATLVSLFVNPKAAGSGVGKTMLLFLLDKMRASGVAEVKIDSSLNAAGFYSKYGFVEAGRSMYRTQSGIAIESIQMVYPVSN